MCFAPSLKSFYYRHAYACRSPVPMHSKLKFTPKLSFDKALGRPSSPSRAWLFVSDTAPGVTAPLAIGDAQVAGTETGAGDDRILVPLVDLTLGLGHEGGH